MLWFNHRKKSVFLEEVVYLKSFENYTRFYLKSGQNFLTSFTMKKYEQQLTNKGGFTRIHRGTLLNLKYLLGFEKTNDGHQACLSTGEKIGISRRKMKKFELLSE